MKHRNQSIQNSRRRLWLQSLEDRTVPALFTVTNLVDENIANGLMSLREAISLANDRAGL